MRTRRRTRHFSEGLNAPSPLKATAFRSVRFQELDLMGIVWHGHYIDYFEDGRCVVGKTYGLDYPDFYREKVKAPIVSLEINYSHPLLLGDSFRIETSLHWTEAVRLNYSYEVKRENDGLVICRGSTVQLLLDMENKLLIIWPEYFRQFREKWKNGELIKKDA